MEVTSYPAGKQSCMAVNWFYSSNKKIKWKRYDESRLFQMQQFSECVLWHPGVPQEAGKVVMGFERNSFQAFPQDSAVRPEVYNGMGVFKKHYVE